MANITLEKIRATISFSGITVETPHIKSFSVNRQRGQLSASFSATLEIPVEDLFNASPLASDITIEAGADGTLNRIFTGEIRQLSIEPSWDKPEYQIVQISGNDIFIRMEGRTFSRRVKWESGGIWAKITSIERTHLSRGSSSLDRKIPRSGGRTIVNMPDPNDAQHDTFIYARDLSRIDPYGKIQKPKDVSSDYKEMTFTVRYV